MKNIRLGLLIILLLSLKAVDAQYTFFRPEGSFAIEVSLENTKLKRLPIYRNSITSLCVVNDLIVGGTSTFNNSSPFLFIASIKKQDVTDIFDLKNRVTGQYAIRSGFVKDRSGNTLYAGTMPDGSVSRDGHLLQIKIDNKGKLVVEDLGIPVSGEGVFALTGNDNGSVLYGISYPSGYFFSYNIKTEKTRIYKNTASSEAVVQTLNKSFSLTPKEFLSNALVTDRQGFVYGSLPYGKLFCFDVNRDTVLTLDAEIPFVWGRRTIGQVQSWLKTKDGKIYGANSADGQLFELDTDKQIIKNLGKAIMMPGVSGLAEAANGKIYGVAGGSSGYAHLFSYDEESGFTDYGNPDFEMYMPDIDLTILWRGFQLSSIAASDDGRYIVMGENESLSQLMVFSIK